MVGGVEALTDQRPEIVRLLTHGGRHDRALRRCGKEGVRGAGDAVWDPRQAPEHLMLRPTPAAIWPDGRERLLCCRCRNGLTKAQKRLIRTATGWGHMT